MNFDIDPLINIALKAGDIIMKYYNSCYIDTFYKKDSSPVSKADIESNDCICSELLKLYPKIPIISEEGKSFDPIEDLFWSIDPLDGTKSFLNKSGEFTINIALIKKDTPILGIVYSPLNKKLYYVSSDNIPYIQLSDGTKRIIKTRQVPKEGLTVVISSYSTNEQKVNQYLKDKVVDKIILTSSALKICMIAEGEADVYPRFGKTMEWDTAAGHAILRAAGGEIKDLKGFPLTYGHSERSFLNPEFIAVG